MNIEETVAELQRRLDAVYREYMRDSRRGGPDHMAAHRAWQERRREAQTWFAEQLKNTPAGGAREPTREDVDGKGGESR